MNALNSLISDPLVSGIFLFIGLACMVLELFVPSGGVLGLLAVGAAIFGIYGLFHQGQPLLAVAAIAFFCIAFWWLTKIMIRKLNFTSSLSPETSNSVDSRIGDLVGKEGTTLTQLHPAGMARIEGRKIDVVTLGDFIDKDVPVRVVDNSGNRVVVRRTDSRSENG